MSKDQIEWHKIAKFRDMVSHHYSHVDHEIVYDLCKVHIPRLSKVLKKMCAALEENSEA